MKLHIQLGIGSGGFEVFRIMVYVSATYQLISTIIRLSFPSNMDEGYTECPNRTNQVPLLLYRYSKLANDFAHEITYPPITS